MYLFIWLKKPRYRRAFWNFLNPHVSHQHPTLTKYFASNCAAEVFLSLLLWSSDVRGCFLWLGTDSQSGLRSGQKKTLVKPQRTKVRAVTSGRFECFYCTFFSTRTALRFRPRGHWFENEKLPSLPSTHTVRHQWEYSLSCDWIM